MSSEEQKVPLEKAQLIGGTILKMLEPVTERIHIAGSTRRGRPLVKDVEIVAIPKFRFGGQRNLFGEGTEQIDCLDERVRQLCDRSFFDKHPKDPKMGPRYKKMIYVACEGCQIQIDLFAVIPPSQWGVIFTLRTGPGPFSKGLAVYAKSVGFRIHEGGLYEYHANGDVLIEGRHARLVPTPEEDDVFTALRLPHWKPEERDNPEVIRTLDEEWTM